MCEAAGHTASRETNAGALLTLFFFLLTQFLPPVHRLVLPTFRVGFSSPVKPLWKCSHRYSQRVIPWVPLNPAKMKTETNLHTECPFLLLLSIISPPPRSVNMVHSANTAVKGSIDESEVPTKNPRLPETDRIRTTWGEKKDCYNLVTSDTDKHQSLKTPE